MWLFDKFFLITLAFLLSFQVAGCDRVNGSSEEQLEFVKVRHSFGSVPAGLTLKVSFPFRNASDHPAEILEIARSCTCADAKTNTSVVGPGKHGTIDVTMSSGNEQKTIDATILVIVRFKGNIEKKYSLEVTGETVRNIVILPPNCDFGEVAQDNGIVAKEIRLSRGKENIPWTQVVADSHHRAIGLQIKNIDSDNYKLEISLDPKYQPIGAFVADAIIQTIGKNSDTTSKNIIRVTANITGGIVAVPNSFYLGSLIQGKLYSQKISLIQANGILSDVTATTNRPDVLKNIKVDIGKEASISFDVEPINSLGKFHAEIIISGKVSSSFKIKVPVIFVVQ